MLLILVALVSPLAALDYELLWAHMAQHLLLADLGALLIVLGLTGPLLQPLLATRGLGWLRVLSQPAVALPLWLANLYLWHVPGLYQAAISSEAVHALEHACFVGFGIAMWMALLGPLPKPAWFGNGARLVYVVVVRLGGAVLANVLLWAGSPLYPDYARGRGGPRDLAAGGPGRGGRRDDGRAGPGDHGPVRLALLPRRDSRATSARRCSTWRRSAACRSTRPAPRGRWRPARASGFESGSPAGRSAPSRVRSLAARDRFLAWLVTGPVGSLGRLPPGLHGRRGPRGDQ